MENKLSKIVALAKKAIAEFEADPENLPAECPRHIEPSTMFLGGPLEHARFYGSVENVWVYISTIGNIAVVGLPKEEFAAVKAQLEA